MSEDLNIPAGLGERGLRLYRSMADASTPAEREILITEAARMADRLDDLHEVVQGRGVLGLIMAELESDPTVDGAARVDVTLKFQGVMAEFRQLTTAFGNTLKTLGFTSEMAAGPAVPAAKPKTGADMLAEKRRARAAAG